MWPMRFDFEIFITCTVLWYSCTYMQGSKKISWGGGGGSYRFIWIYEWVVRQWSDNILYFNLAYKLNSSLVVQKYQYSRTCCTYVLLWFLLHKYGHEYFFCYCCIPKLYNIYKYSYLNMFLLYMYFFRVKKNSKNSCLVILQSLFSLDDDDIRTDHVWKRLLQDRRAGMSWYKVF